MEIKLILLMKIIIQNIKNTPGNQDYKEMERIWEEESCREMIKHKNEALFIEQ